MEQTETMQLPVTLTDDEMRTRGEQLAMIVRDYAEVEGEKKEATSRLGERLKVLRADMDRLGEIVRSRQEHRPVTVEHQRDFQRDLVVTVRLDTGETVSSRPMTLAERQQALFPMVAAPTGEKRDPN